MKSYWVHSENIVFLFLCNDVLIIIIAASAAPLWLSLLSHTNLLRLVRSLSCPLSEQSTLLSRDSLIVWRPHTHTHTRGGRHACKHTPASAACGAPALRMKVCGSEMSFTETSPRMGQCWLTISVFIHEVRRDSRKHSWRRLHVAGLYIWGLFHMYIIWRCSGRMEMKLC